MPVISANGARFHFQLLEPEPLAWAGAPAPTVVFVHGLVIDNLSSFYYTLAGPVVAAGARVLLYDLRGHGKSEQTPEGYTTRDGAADLGALLDALGLTEPVYLVGNSYGGIIAARMAIAAPERVAGLVLIEACCAGPAADDWLENMLNSLTAGVLSLEHHRTAEVFRAVGRRRIARQAMAAEALLNGTCLIDDVAAERPLDSAELATLGCPVLGVYGERSDLVDGADDLRRHVRHCQVEVIPKLAHTVLREATGALAEIVLDWLRQQAQAQTQVQPGTVR